LILQLRESCDVSIVIPTRDRPLLLRDAVASALLALNGVAGEVVVVDDHSAVSAADSLSDIQDARLWIQPNGRSSGASGSRNSGVEAAVGDLIVFLDDDDLLRPGYIHWILEMAKRDPAVSYGFSAIHRFSGMINDSCLVEFRSPTGQCISDLPITKRLAGLGCGFWVRRSVYLELDGLDERLSVNEDTDFCISLLAKSMRGIYSSEAGVMVRAHSLASSGDRASVTKLTSWLERAHNFERIMGKHNSTLWAMDRLRLYLLFRLIKMIAKTGHHDFASRVIGRWGQGQALKCWFYYYLQRIAWHLRALPNPF
jgi:glycosyltransferase involved in cell wall biosynthesis